MKRKTKLIYTDPHGNKLYEKQLKTRTQYFGKNAENKLVDEKSLAILMKKSGLLREYQMTPISPKGRRISRYAITEKIIPIKVM